MNDPYGDGILFGVSTPLVRPEGSKLASVFLAAPDGVFDGTLVAEGDRFYGQRSFVYFGENDALLPVRVSHVFRFEAAQAKALVGLHHTRAGAGVDRSATVSVTGQN